MEGWRKTDKGEKVRYHGGRIYATDNIVAGSRPFTLETRSWGSEIIESRIDIQDCAHWLRAPGCTVPLLPLRLPRRRLLAA